MSASPAEEGRSSFSSAASVAIWTRSRDWVSPEGEDRHPFAWANQISRFEIRVEVLRKGSEYFDSYEGEVQNIRSGFTIMLQIFSLPRRILSGSCGDDLFPSLSQRTIFSQLLQSTLSFRREFVRVGSPLDAWGDGCVPLGTTRVRWCRIHQSALDRLPRAPHTAGPSPTKPPCRLLRPPSSAPPCPRWQRYVTNTAT